jgi:hypothetical protein
MYAALLGSRGYSHMLRKQYRQPNPCAGKAGEIRTLHLGASERPERWFLNKLAGRMNDTGQQGFCHEWSK